MDFFYVIQFYSFMIIQTFTWAHNDITILRWKSLKRCLTYSLLPYRLRYDQDVILDTIKNMLDEFDAELRTLHHDKLHLEVALKSADLRFAV